MKTNNLLSKGFPENEDIRHEGVSSPMICDLVMDDVIKEAKIKTSKLLVLQLIRR